MKHICICTPDDCKKHETQSSVLELFNPTIQDIEVTIFNLYIYIYIYI